MANLLNSNQIGYLVLFPKHSNGNILYNFKWLLLLYRKKEEWLNFSFLHVN